MKLLNAVLMVLLLLVSYSASLVSTTNSSGSSKESIQIFRQDNGVRIIVGDVELYFNASNGGEITEYFDLTVDPLRLNNLANIRWKPYYNLLPLYTSLFYNPYLWKVFSTGPDYNAIVELVANTTKYVILQTSSRIMNRLGEIYKDAFGNAIKVNSTWIVHDSGLISVERTFLVPTYLTISSGWRWYPFYLTRTKGFNYNGTFVMFNTTYTDTSVVNEATYKDVFSLYHLLPNDTRHVFGVALPFSNTGIGGDGTHNILIAYEYDELLNVNQWRSDNYYNQKRGVTEAGAVYEFSKATNISTHTYHMIVNFTHQPLNEENILNFANYYAEGSSVALTMECSITGNKDVYKLGDYYTFYASGISYYALTNLRAKFVIKNNINQVIYEQNFGPANIKAGQTFNVFLLSGKVNQNSVPGNYKLSFQIRSSVGILITFGNKAITVATE
jgi:hypothetical protein